MPQAPFTCAWSSARRWFTPGATRRTLALAIANAIANAAAAAVQANMIARRRTTDLPTIYRNEKQPVQRLFVA